ncbi:MAG: hypothetical protein AABY22_22370 [Nanoarchaeota archaeon]
MTYQKMYINRHENRIISISDQIALKILDLFEEKEGFNHWWHDIEKEDRNDIYQELKEIISGS